MQHTYTSADGQPQAHMAFAFPSPGRRDRENRFMPGPRGWLVLPRRRREKKRHWGILCATYHTYLLTADEPQSMLSLFHRLSSERVGMCVCAMMGVAA